MRHRASAKVPPVPRTLHDKPRGMAGLAVALALAACSRLPDFAAPRGGSLDPSTPPGDWIRYRALERSDFKRAAPPGKTKDGSYELGAQTCAYIKTSSDVQIDIVNVTEPSGATRVEGRLRNLHFVAWMDRECSWWNPTNDDVRYTLEHEQVHFAISELAARKLNQEAASLMRELHVNADTQKEVVDEIQTKVKALLDEQNDAALDRNRAFDEETSAGKFPVQQHAWHERIERELRASKAWQ